MRLPLFIANWKMHKNVAQAEAFVDGLPGIPHLVAHADIAIAPQSIHLIPLESKLQGSGMDLAAQNCGQAQSGAFTGEDSPASLKDLGVRYVILGHSERRWIYHEDGFLITGRLIAALGAGLEAVLCIGERLEERKTGKTFAVLQEQLEAVLKVPASQRRGIVLAYEPVWAIGTGETATPEQAKEAHAFIRKWLSEQLSLADSQSIRILYGGSVKPDNAAALMAVEGIDGLLVGGASLSPLGFAELVQNGVRSVA